MENYQPSKHPTLPAALHKPADAKFGFQSQQDVRALPWPAKSPNMPPTKRIWDVLV